MHVRPAVPADFPALKPMLLDMGFVDDEAALEARFPSFCGDLLRPLLVAGADGGELTGYAALHDYGISLRPGNSHRTAKLEDLYTAPVWRQRGVARLLMRAVEDWARARPLRYVFWYANTHEAGPAYVRMGYRPDDAGQEGFLFFEIDFGNPSERLPHPQRGS
ncbi:GNAT family N-acetyltransferase [Deinococcus marmoris]|uniref:Aminoglycoside acetyltransferase (6') type I n=1 Tax=Deinococcus marmoris TaxID=249408 RepID=A0A1U7P0V5_9DEIO|nr:GNAT family N-acetyltransferase [Deinococcus marmoris]OLV18790.1 aminoglycoside acetyltransferase (6') type I [Deinococcus marmoris]